MEIEVIESGPEVSHVVLTGRLDAAGVYSVEELFKNYVESRMKPTIVDLSHVTYIASVGMRMLLASAKALKERGIKMILLKPQPLVDEALRTTCLDQLVPIVSDERLAFIRVK